MSFYLIGLGLNLKSISIEALEVLKKCSKIYLENYTVDFPYTIKELEKNLKVKLVSLNREPVENESFLDEAKNQDVALLVYGDCLSATTHFSMIKTCKDKNIPFRIFHNSSIMTAVSDSGLQLYKFGKTASMPSWQKSFRPDSFVNLVKDNLSIGAHTLLLVDIGLEFDKAREQLETSFVNHNLKLEKVVVCSSLGTESQKIFYSQLSNMKNVNKPFCFIIPAKEKDLHFTEKEFLSLL